MPCLSGLYSVFGMGYSPARLDVRWETLGPAVAQALMRYRATQSNQQTTKLWNGG